MTLGTLRMMLVGADQKAAITAENRLSGVTNYLTGNDPSQWRRGIPHYGRVRYSAVWPGIDLLFHGRDQSLEYDFVVAPGADPNEIRLRFEDVQSLRLDANGDLILATASGKVRQHRPEIYQVSAGVRHTLAGSYRIVDGREVRFHIPTYDPRLTLVIDPVITYSTNLAGTGTAKLNAMTLDSSGNLYLTGRASSPDFPGSGSGQTPSGLGLYRTENRATSWTVAGNGIGPAKVLALARRPEEQCGGVRRYIARSLQDCRRRPYVEGRLRVAERCRHQRRGGPQPVQHRLCLHERGPLPKPGQRRHLDFRVNHSDTQHCPGRKQGRRDLPRAPIRADHEKHRRRSQLAGDRHRGDCELAGGRPDKRARGLRRHQPDRRLYEFRRRHHVGIQQRRPGQRRGARYGVRHRHRSANSAAALRGYFRRAVS